MNCALMFIISNHYGRKCLDYSYSMYNVISDNMAHCYDMRNTTKNNAIDALQRKSIVH